MLDCAHVRVLFREGQAECWEGATLSPCQCGDSVAFRHLLGSGEALTTPSIPAISKEILQCEKYARALENHGFKYPDQSIPHFAEE